MLFLTSTNENSQGILNIQPKLNYMRYLFFILILSFCSMGRSAEDFNYNYGIEGGVNFSNVAVSPSSNTDNKLGGVGGLYWEFFPGDVFSLLTGGYWLGKGYKEVQTDQRVVLNYGELRFLGRLCFYRNSSSRFFLDFGGGADFILQKGTQNFASPSNLDPFFNNFDLNSLGGFGYEKAINEEVTLAFNIKYHYGLLNVSKQNSRAHSHGIMVTTAIQFSRGQEKVFSTEDRAREFLNRTK